MDPVGIGAVGLALVAGLTGGAWWKRTNGRLRDVPVDGRRKLSDPDALLGPTQNGVGVARGAAVDRAAPVDDGRKLSDPAGSLAHTPDGVGAVGAIGADGRLPLDAVLLAGLGVDAAGREVTLLQFSSTHCAPCRAVSRISSEVAGEVPGVRHVEVDAETHLDAVRELGIWRTPTLLVLDREGRVVKRATGVPQKPQLIAAVSETL